MDEKLSPNGGGFLFWHSGNVIVINPEYLNRELPLHFNYKLSSCGL